MDGRWSYEIYAKARQAKGLKDADVSRMTGVKTSTICDWRKGRYSPKAQKLSLIAKAVGINLIDLIQKPEES